MILPTQLGSSLLVAALALAWSTWPQGDSSADNPDATRTADLDAYWASVSKAVSTGNLAAYRATFHEDAVLVSGISQKSYPISKAFQGWQTGFEQTKQGKISPLVEFRFTNRVGDGTTAHEQGMFHYSTTTKSGETTSVFIHFEALLVKKDGHWLAMMEYQKSMATADDWHALSPSPATENR